MPYETQNQNQSDQKKDQFSSQSKPAQADNNIKKDKNEDNMKNQGIGSTSSKPSQGSAKP